MNTCQRCLKPIEFKSDHGWGICPLEARECFFRTNSDLLYDFVDDRIAPKPIQIHSKRQWKRLLKDKNLTDDVPKKGSFTSLKSKPFDRKWDVTITEAIKKSVAEVKQKSFSVVGKKFTQSQMKSVLRNDLVRQRREKVNA